MRFLDATDDHMEREVDDDEEQSLGFLEGFPGQGRGSIYGEPGDDREAENEHDEPSLGSHEIRSGGAVSYLCHPVSAAGEMVYDCEGGHDGRDEDTGIGDVDGLLEQTGGLA